jgi:hypothetical protein
MMPDYDGPERRAVSDEDRQLWRDYMRTYGERLKMETDKLPVLIAGMERIERGQNELRVILLGNGTVEKSLCFRVSQMEIAVKTVNDRLNTVFKTDDWRKDFMAGAIRSVATAVIAAALLHFLIR